MQKIKHLSFIFILILVFASSAWSVDLNCPGGRWALVTTSDCSGYCCTWQCGQGYIGKMACNDKTLACSKISGGTYIEYWSGDVHSNWGSDSECPREPCSSTYYSHTKTYEWKCPCTTEGQTQPCPYSGPVGTEGIGACRAGIQTCQGGYWAACEGEVLPQTEICNDGIDNNCNGQTDEGCAVCIEGETRPCAYSGPAGTENVGICEAGTQTCVSGQWGSCTGEVLPATETCSDNKDNNCNGQTDETCVGQSCNNGTNMGSSANFASGNLYHAQDLFTLTNGVALTLNYNSIDTYTGPLGKGWTHNYNILIIPNPDGSLGLKKEDGNTIYFWQTGGVYYPENRSGDHSTIIKNADATYTQTTKEGTTYTFNTSGRLTQIKDRNSNTTALAYTGDNLTSITDSSGRTTNITSSNGKILSITDLSNNVYTLTYSGDSLASIKDPSQNTWQYTYDANSRMLTKTDPNSYITTYTYDTNGRVTTSTDPEGKTKAISYEPSANSATVTEKDGGIWTHKYDNNLNVLLQSTDPNNNTTTYTYDTNKNITSKTDPDGSATTYTYDDSGNMTSTTDALNQTTTYTYNTYGQVTGITASDGTTTTYTYDTNGNLTQTTDSTGAITKYEYDTKGNITKITNANGQTTILTYDQNNNLISIKDPTGATTSFTYDTAGNMTSQTDASGNITKFEYNSMNQLIKITDPNGNTTTYTYNKNGNRASETDGNSNTTYYEYNYRGQLTKVKDALGNITQYSYGGSGCPSCTGADKLTAITDAKGQVTTYQYDTLGRLTKETDPLGNEITYVYDSKNNLTSKKDANGNTTTHTYDSLNRLLKKKYPDTTEETFTYDSKGNILAAANQNISYTFAYDANARVTSVTDSNGRTINYEYNVLGSKTKTAYPDGTIVNFTYDAANRLSSILNGSGRTYSYQYDNLGRRTKLSYPNGVTTNYSYDSAGLLTSLITQNSQLQTLNSFAYTHDNVGNRLTKTEPVRSAAYTYDKTYRLITAVNSKTVSGSNPFIPQDEAYTYDPAGNRLTSMPNRDYTYNQANQLVNYKGKAYIYDKNGNLTIKTDEDYDLDTEIEGWTYTYDYENRLIKVVKNEQNETKAITFKYDPFGRRMEKKVESIDKGVAETSIQTYVYDNEDIIFKYITKTSNGATTTETKKYLHGPGIDEHLSLTNDTGTYYYHADGLGSITALTDGSGNVVQTYEYDSFGKVHDNMNAIKQPYTFTGREWDKETGLYYYRARYYDAETGRFVSFDPILHPGNGPLKTKSCSQTGIYPTFDSLKRSPQKLNPFIYTENNAVNFTDPSGLGPCEDAAMPCFSAASDRLFQCRKNVFQLAVACTTGCIPLCLASGPAFGQCFVVCEAGCTAGAGAGFTACSAIAAAERIQCALQYRRCKKDRCEPLLPFSLE